MILPRHITQRDLSSKPRASGDDPEQDAQLVADLELNPARAGMIRDRP